MSEIRCVALKFRPHHRCSDDSNPEQLCNKHREIVSTGNESYKGKFLEHTDRLLRRSHSTGVACSTKGVRAAIFQQTCHGLVQVKGRNVVGMNRSVQRSPSRKLLHNRHHAIKLVTVAAFPPLLALFQGFQEHPLVQVTSTATVALRRHIGHSGILHYGRQVTSPATARCASRGPINDHLSFERTFPRRLGGLGNAVLGGWPKDGRATKTIDPCLQRFGRVGQICLMTARPSKSTQSTNSPYTYVMSQIYASPYEALS